MEAASRNTTTEPTVGGERIMWLFPDDIDVSGEEVHFAGLEMRTTKNKGDPWAVYIVQRKKDGDLRYLSGFALTSKEKYKVTDLLHRDFILVRQGSRVRLVKTELTKPVEEERIETPVYVAEQTGFHQVGTIRK